ncbi:hypothetical protein GUJ93_ZPchr0011g27709 [Zizania palustris]|uniref:Uncharacterized protein n=1 Tax=Zizania palustris TaxID=103762 RepID=A0A8J6BRR3_ZIZPA|nr:hypothetical protein GUJ93_ZPchr0011g27709 [Zizania palustris]
MDLAEGVVGTGGGSGAGGAAHHRSLAAALGVTLKDYGVHSAPYALRRTPYAPWRTPHSTVASRPPWRPPEFASTPKRRLDNYG